ncbi:hypothetical protein LY78DRAFT_695948 [Colletotrichum sublineola]|nr:hypothetical protein LY78DRAFT_695948 [Colletotrichum sublineola]
MHASTVSFAPLALLVGLVAALPQQQTPNAPGTGNHCCNGGVADNGFCKGLGLFSFCCTADSEISPDKGHGCDPVPEFPTGRNVEQFVPFGPGSVGTACSVQGINVAGTLTGFIGCAEA